MSSIVRSAMASKMTFQRLIALLVIQSYQCVGRRSMMQIVDDVAATEDSYASQS